MSCSTISPQGVPTVRSCCVERIAKTVSFAGRSANIVTWYYFFSGEKRDARTDEMGRARGGLARRGAGRCVRRRPIRRLVLGRLVSGRHRNAGRYGGDAARLPCVPCRADRTPIAL